MSLFASRTPRPQGIAYRQRVAAERRRLLDHFAECLAEGGSTTQCAAQFGKGAGWGAGALKEIREGLGWEQTR